MNKHLFTLVIALVFSSLSFSQQYGSFKDSRDGKVYKTVKIGTQEWMAENLNISKFKNGDPIPEAKTFEQWIKAGELKKPAWCFYNNNSAKGMVHGKLYNWYAVNDPRGLAPDGWHIPSKVEFDVLIKFLGGGTIAGNKIKSKSMWADKGNGNNLSGFTGLPSGFRWDEDFDSNGTASQWWSATEDDKEMSQSRDEHHVLKGTSYSLQVDNMSKEASLNGAWNFYGFSVRCIKD